MASRRDLIRMSDDEVREFLAASKTIILSSIGPGGYPHPMPMWFAVDGDGTVRMTTFRRSQKVRNLERDPHVSLLVEAGEVYDELRGVVLYGKAEIVDDLAVVKATLRPVSAFAPPADPAAQKAAGGAVGK